MVISLSEIPRRERHLLFCSDNRVEPRWARRRSRRRGRRPRHPSTTPKLPLLPIPAAAGFDAAGTVIGLA